nr:retron system putative HNH endonuclease [Corynebacterium kalidii]
MERPDPEPECLADMRAGQSWGDLPSACKGTVREALEVMHSDLGPPLCSYCEWEILTQEKGHIEHLYPRSIYPDETFSWGNLYLSCNHPDHCGQFKDRSGRPRYRPEDLIRPDNDDPAAFLRCSSSGEIRPREGLSPTDRQRAMTTIDVLGLNAPALQGKRRAVVKRASDLLLPELDFLASLEPDEREDLLAGEIAAFRAGGNPSAALHFIVDMM